MVKLPEFKHAAGELYSPAPYFRHFLIRSSGQYRRSAFDVLNSKPYRFNLSKLQISHLLDKRLLRIYTPTTTSLLSPSTPSTLPLPNFSVVSYNQHVHETAVPRPARLDVVYYQDNIIVVDKPKGIPVHPVQKYYHNTIQHMLANQIGVAPESLYPIHRLDKLTSGILIFATTQQTAATLKTCSKEKLYLARIKGRLVRNQCHDDLVYIYPTRHMLNVYTNAKTEFRELAHDFSRNESIVLAKLFSGYPHQIRIHLRNLGTPIIDDPLYGSRGKYREIIKSKDQVTEQYWRVLLSRSELVKSILQTGATCDQCGQEKYSDPQILGICLHAWRYTLQFDADKKIQLQTRNLPIWMPKNFDFLDNLEENFIEI